MKKILLLTLISFVLVGCTITEKEKIENPKAVEAVENSTYQEVGLQRAYELMIKEEGLVVLDVSSAYDKGHLLGAINHYVGDGSLDNVIDSLDKNVPYLVYCHVDSASILGAQKLIDAGVNKVYRLEGNYGSWVEQGFPVEIALQPVSNINGTVKAERETLYYDLGHNIKASIPDPENNKFYEGWLVKGAEFVSTGKLENNNGIYELIYTAEREQLKYNEVVITLETESNGLDNVPEEHIFEGKF